MLCYRCGSHVPDGSETCESCGQPLTGGRSGAASRRRPGEVDAPFKVGDVLSRRYRIKEVIGQGPLGFVFRAADEQVDVEVAIKLLNPRLLQSEEEQVHFSKAIRASRKFSHPSLARTFEDGAHEGWPFFTAPCCDGMSLRRILEPRLAKRQFFTLKEIEPIFAQLAAAVDAAHLVGTHGDLKPENVIIQPDVLKVTDFGLGLAVPRLPFIQAQKATRGDRYLSPEYLAGEEVDPRADVYALGVILGEMLCGQVPGDGLVPSLRTPGRDIPMALEGLYRRAVNENPAARCRNASELLVELRALAGTGRTQPPPIRTRVDSPGAQPRSGPAPTVAELPSVDETMPISAAELATRLGEVTLAPAARLADDTPEITTSERPRREERGHRTPAAGVPAFREPPTAAMPLPQEVTLAPPEPPLSPPPRARSASRSGPAPLFAAAREEAGNNRGMLFLTLLCVTGLALGAGGGLWLVRTLHARSTPSRQAPPSAPGPSSKAGPPGTAAHVLPAQPAPAKEVPVTPPPVTPGPGTPEPLPEEGPKHAVVAPHAPVRHDPRPQVQVASAARTVSCPSGMKLVPGGTFRQGTARDDPMMGFDERPLNTVEVRAFCVDEFEFPDKRGAAPTVKVAWLDAKRACEKLHRRLCTETEWEKACKGPSGLRYPYGNAFDANACATEDAAGQDRTLATSGRYSRCRSGYGVFDLSGNAAEWTATSYAGGGKVVKGGAFNKQDYAARCSARKSAGASNRSAEVGFRCCADPVP